VNATGFRTFLRFCAAGVAGLLVDTAVLYATAPLLGWYGARVVSFLAAATATWWLNRLYTFAAAGPMPPRAVFYQYLRYLQAMMLGGLVNYLVYAATILFIKVPAAPMMGVALGSCAGLAFNFISARHFVFGARQGRRRS
jgi:putative flippase GtrA